MNGDVDEERTRQTRAGTERNERKRKLLKWMRRKREREKERRGSDRA